MIRLLELLIAFVIVAIVFVIIGVFLPRRATVERSVELTNPIVQVFDTVNGYRKFANWSAFTVVDPRAKTKASGPQSGEGATFSWESFEKGVGKGNIEIIESVPNERVVAKLTNFWRGDNKRSSIFLKTQPTTGATRLLWKVSLDCKWDLLCRYQGMYLNGRMGELMRTSLNKLATTMASYPNVDYSQVDIGEVDTEVKPLLYVESEVTSIPIEWATAEAVQDSAWMEVEAFIAANNLVATGPRTRVVVELAEEKNIFQMGIPVAAIDAVAPTGNVRIGQLPATTAVRVSYVGHRVGLNRPRDMLRAYSLTHGYTYDPDYAGTWEEWPPTFVPENATFEPNPTTVLYMPVE